MMFNPGAGASLHCASCGCHILALVASAIHLRCFSCQNLVTFAGVPSLFLPYDSTAPSPGELGKTGIVEVQAVAPVNARSWFLGEQEAVAGENLYSSHQLLGLIPVQMASSWS